MTEKQIEAQISEINIFPESLRGVNLTSPQFIEFSNNVKSYGVLTPIRLTTVTDSTTGEAKLYLVDGLQRYTAAKNAGFETIKAVLHPDMTKMDVLREQFTLNIQRIETKPVEYSRQLMRMLQEDASLTVDKLAQMIGRSPTYVKERLSLTNLTNTIAEVVDGNGMGLTSAACLAKLPPEEQEAFLERATSMAYNQFAPLVDERLRELRKAKMEGRVANAENFVLIAKIKKQGEIEEETKNGKAKVALIEQAEATTAEQGFELALAWVLGIDPISAQAKEEAWKADQEEKKKRAEKAKQEREEKREHSAELKTKRMQYQLRLRQQGDLSPEEIAHKMVDWDIQNGVVKV